MSARSPIPAGTRPLPPGFPPRPSHTGCPRLSPGSSGPLPTAFPPRHNRNASFPPRRRYPSGTPIRHAGIPGSAPPPAGARCRTSATPPPAGRHTPPVPPAPGRYNRAARCAPTAVLPPPGMDRLPLADKTVRRFG